MDTQKVRNDRFLLPNPWVAIGRNRASFLDRIEGLLKEMADAYTNVSREIQVLLAADGWRGLIFTPRDQRGQTGLVGSIFLSPNEKGIARVEVRATAWDSPAVTSARYVRVLRGAFRPILEAYLCRYDKKLEINLSEREWYPELPPDAKTLFQRFMTSLDKRTTMGHLQWRTFDRFVLHCHGRRVKLTRFDLRAMLEDAGFTAPLSDQLAEVYGHGRRLLQGPGLF
jgi:hypothetical protein